MPANVLLLLSMFCYYLQCRTQSDHRLMLLVLYDHGLSLMHLDFIFTLSMIGHSFRGGDRITTCLVKGDTTCGG